MTESINLAELPPQQQVILLLEDALREARSGLIASLAIVAVAKSGAIMTPAAGPSLSDLNLGVDILKTRLLAAAQQPSRILRPV